MFHLKFLRRIAITIVLMSIAYTASASASDTETVLYSFHGGKDEGDPYGNLISDLAGNLYGTACGNDDYLYGTAFELIPVNISPNTRGWGYKELYLFMGSTDGNCPRAGMIMDAVGNLYGTTTGGGNLNYCNYVGCGTVFKLSRTPSGNWKETVLYAFTDGPDGGAPYAGLVFDKAGNLYGTALQGGQQASCCGVVFKLTPRSNGKWSESVIHTFGNGADGESPYSGVIFDSAGNLFGTTSNGGSGGYGTVYELSPTSNGWQETTLYSFKFESDGGVPIGGLAMDVQGNLYGTTSEAGGGSGTVFELTPSSNGWTETVLHTFQGSDGAYPKAGVVLDASGNLYGTTSYGSSDGTVFQLVKNSQGWSENVLYSFSGGTDGGEPESTLLLDKFGNLYGSASEGGALGWGCIFRVTSESSRY